MSLGIVIPSYRPDIGLLSAYIDSLSDRLAPSEILVELDAPQSDETVTTLRQKPVILHVSSDRRGKGAAITHGFDSLDTDIRMFLDADGSTMARSAADIYESVRDGEAEICVGSRRQPSAEIVNHQTVTRRYMGDLFAWAARQMLPIALQDYQCGAKAVTSQAWHDIRTHLYESGFAWDLELVAIADAMGYEVAETPVQWEDQPGSTVELPDAVVEFSRALLAVRHRSLAIEGDRIHRSLPASNSPPLVAGMDQD